jgi:hypothetical protein
VGFRHPLELMDEGVRVVPGTPVVLSCRALRSGIRKAAPGGSIRARSRATRRWPAGFDEGGG